jgi:hypothetical protein
VKLNESMDFKGSCSSLKGMVRDLGFRWKKTNTYIRILTEKARKGKAIPVTGRGGP